MSQDALGRPAERGVTLVALMVSITIMLVVMAMILPGWRYLEKNEREEELLFRGKQIADAIQLYQRKNGNALPPSLELLVRGRFLRRLYKDPTARDGKWRLYHLGEPQICPEDARGLLGGGAAPGMVTAVGPIAGVVSRSADKGLRTINGRTRYCEWFFIAGQQGGMGFQFFGGRARVIRPPKLLRGGTPPRGSSTPQPLPFGPGPNGPPDGT
jgi:type II secretory pathway pseudopilin PulG